ATRRCPNAEATPRAPARARARRSPSPFRRASSRPTPPRIRRSAGASTSFGWPALRRRRSRLSCVCHTAIPRWKQVLLHFAECGAWQRVDADKRARNLERRELGATDPLQLSQLEFVFDGNVRNRDLTACVVGNADDSRLAH